MSRVVPLQNISSWPLCSPFPEPSAFPEGTKYVPHGAFQAPCSPCHLSLGTNHAIGLSLSLQPKQVTISPRACGAGQRGWPKGKATASIAPVPWRGLSWGPLRSQAGWFSLSWTPAPPTMDTGWIFPPCGSGNCSPKAGGVIELRGPDSRWIFHATCHSWELFLRNTTVNTKRTQFSIPFVSLHVIWVPLDHEDAKNHLLSLPITSLESIHTNFFSFSHNKDPQWQLWYIG